jgi:hypothetical protein
MPGHRILVTGTAAAVVVLAGGCSSTPVGLGNLDRGVDLGFCAAPASRPVILSVVYLLVRRLLELAVLYGRSEASKEIEILVLRCCVGIGNCSPAAGPIGAADPAGQRPPGRSGIWCCGWLATTRAGDIGGSRAS